MDEQSQTYVVAVRIPKAYIACLVTPGRQMDATILVDGPARFSARSANYLGWTVARDLFEKQQRLNVLNLEQMTAIAEGTGKLIGVRPLTDKEFVAFIGGYNKHIQELEDVSVGISAG